MATRVKVPLQKRLEKCIRPLDNPNCVRDISYFLLEALPLLKEFLLLQRKEKAPTNFGELKNLFQIVNKNSFKQVIRLDGARLFAGAYFHSGLHLYAWDIEKQGFYTEKLERVDDLILWLDRIYNLSKILPCDVESFKICKNLSPT